MLIKVSVLSCLLRGWNTVLKLSEYSEYSTFSLFILREFLLIYSAGLDPALLKFHSVRASGGSQPFTGWYYVTWLVINEKLLPEPRTERHPVKIHSHLCTTRCPAGQTWWGSGKGYGCGFSGLSEALSSRWLAGCWWSSRQLVCVTDTIWSRVELSPRDNCYTRRVVVYQTRSLHGLFRRFWVGTRGSATGTVALLTHVWGQAFNKESENLVRVRGHSSWAVPAPASPG